MQVIKQHKVPEKIENTWIIAYASQIFDEFPTHSSIKKAIKKGLIRLNGSKPNWNTKVEPGMLIELLEHETKSITPINVDFDIVYEDEEIAVINKPAGIEVSGNKAYTIQNALLNTLTKSKSKDSLKNPRPVHRLDYATSGLLIIAKTRSASVLLGNQFEKREVIKTYTALVSGYLEGSGTISTPIDNKEAISNYSVISNSRSIKTNWITKVNLSPKTGRTHQLRIHMSTIGHEIIGDKIHGKGPILKGKGMFLCATKLIFTHPSTKSKMEIIIDTPNKFGNFIETQQKNWEKHNSEINK